VSRKGWEVEAELHDRIVRTWAWIDKYGAALPPTVLSELILALGPDPGVRIDSEAD
jgi:hypothetical protein